MATTKYTGERIETSIYNRNTLEHLHRYAISIDLAKNKRILDIACGEGYGSNILAEVAEDVVGVDISQETIDAASAKYHKSNLKFLKGSADNIPLPDSTFDLVVSFETIEHHNQHDEMMVEVKRVLKKDGVFIISSPNKLNYSDRRNYANPFHVKELYEDEFKALMNKNFTYNSYFHQKVLYGSVMIPEQPIANYTEYNGNFKSISQSNDFESMFIIAISSNATLNNKGLSIFSDNNMYQSVADLYKNSMSYKIGDLLLKPIKSLKGLIKISKR